MSRHQPAPTRSHNVEDPDQLCILVEVETQDAAARPEHGLTEAGIISRRPDHRIPGLPSAAPQRSPRAHRAHAQAVSGTEPGPRRRTRPGNSPRRPAARPAGDHLLSRRDTGRPAMTGAWRRRFRSSPPWTGVSDGPQPPPSQQLLELTELLRTPRPFHGDGVLSQELRMVALRQHGEDPDRVIRIMIINWMRSHSPLRSAPCIELLPTLARTPSVCEQHPRRAPALPSIGQGAQSPDGDLRPTPNYTAQSA